ncbi:MAG: hypothetical protein AMS18_05355 [Gemmatimonas sp. SG8_17]|nr:MAG: hypothetical protein AMS18_05355 [Gemmatimonas sp. SG8_17]
MTAVRLRLLVGCVVCLVAGCGDNTGPVDEALRELVGAWRVSKFEYTSQADSLKSINLAALGVSMNLTISNDGGWTLLTMQPGIVLGQVSTGMLSVQGDSIDFRWDAGPGPWMFGYDVSGDILTMITREAEYTFDQGGQPEPADLEIVMARL